MNKYRMNLHRKILLGLIMIGLLSWLSGCDNRDKVSQIHKGMTEAEVVRIMGSPRIFYGAPPSPGWNREWAPWIIGFTGEGRVRSIGEGRLERSVVPTRGRRAKPLARPERDPGVRGD